MQLIRSRFIGLLSLLAIIVVAGAFAACGDDDNASSTPTKSAGAATTAAGTTAATTAAAGDDITPCPPAGAATKLTGAGATFPGPFYEDLFARYKTLCNVEVNYQSIGSGGGITQITQKTVDFGASDGIMSDTQKAAAPGPIHHIATTSDAVAVIYNINGVASKALSLDGTTLADIYLGKITKWNDPKIAALNSGVTLPADDITVVHRSDGSGTTFIFTNYLGKVSTDWQSGVGSATTVQWPAGVGAEGSAGVAGQVTNLPGSIGYVSLAYAVKNDISYAKLKNKAGNVVEPSLDSAKTAQEGITIPDNMEIVITDSPNAQAYPITGFTWLLVYATQDDKAKAQTLGHLIHWILTDGQQYAEPDNYVPLSDAAKAKALAELADTKFNGTAIALVQ